MRLRLSTVAVLFVLSCSLSLTASVASAGPREDVAAATMKWAQTLGQNDPDKIVLLYATDGVLWGTLSPTVRSDRAALRDYFVSPASRNESALPPTLEGATRIPESECLYFKPVAEAKEAGF